MTRTHLVHREVAAGWRCLVMERLSEVMVMQNLLLHQWLMWGSGAQIPHGKHDIWPAKPHWSKLSFQEFSLAVTRGRRMNCGTSFCIWLGCDGFGQGDRSEMFENQDFLHISQQVQERAGRSLWAGATLSTLSLCPLERRRSSLLSCWAHFPWIGRGEHFLCVYSQEPMTGHWGMA